MPNKLTITKFHEVMKPITELETKFGGQPVWIEHPKWPLSPTTGEKVPFFCQIKLEPEVFGNIAAKMAYLFYQGYDSALDSYDFTAWGIVLQPGNITLQPDKAELIDCDTGPTLRKTIKTSESPYWKDVSVEFAQLLVPGFDQDFEISKNYDPYDSNNYPNEIKIGGSPQLWDCPEVFPDGGNKKWNLLLQCRATDTSGNDGMIPFNHDFGEDGCSWWFISKDGLSADFQFQVH